MTFIPTLMGLALQGVRPILFLSLIALFGPTCMPEEKLLDVLTKRETAPRSRTHEDPTIAKALEFLQQDLNPIQVIGLPEARDIYHKLGVGGPSKTMSMFRAPGDKTDPNIYVNNEGYSYNEARKAKKLNDFRNVRLASQLLHEQVHNTDGEQAARRKEADYIRWQLEELKKIPPSQQEGAREHLRVVESMANGPQLIRK